VGKFLTSNERKELLAELRIERARKYADRIRVILLLDDDLRHRRAGKQQLEALGHLGRPLAQDLLDPVPVNLVARWQMIVTCLHLVIHETGCEAAFANMTPCPAA